MNFLIKILGILGLLLFICYPIGAVLSRGPLGFWAWIIAIFIAYKVGKIIIKE